mgnify:CR=1 FL=1
MSKRVKFSIDEKLYSVNQVIQGVTSRKAEAKRIGISHKTLNDWLRKFEEGGAGRLQELRTWTRYSDETKLCAVKAVIDGGESKRSVVKKYAISSTSVLGKFFGEVSVRFGFGLVLFGWSVWSVFSSVIYSLSVTSFSLLTFLLTFTTTIPISF